MKLQKISLLLVFSLSLQAKTARRVDTQDIRDLAAQEEPRQEAIALERAAQAQELELATEEVIAATKELNAIQKSEKNKVFVAEKKVQQESATLEDLEENAEAGEFEKELQGKIVEDAYKDLATIKKEAASAIQQAQERLNAAEARVEYL